MKELQTALKGFVKQNETLKIETKVSNLKVFSPWSYFYTSVQNNYKQEGHQLFFAKNGPGLSCFNVFFSICAPF